MNAAGQRRLTPVLATACAVAAGVFVVLALGLGRAVHWQAAGRATPLPAASAAAPVAVPPLSHFSDVWRHPLFTSDRKPAPEAGDSAGDVRLGNLELTGIILTPGLRMALLHGPPDRDVNVREGDNVGDSGWTLAKLHAHSAVFVRGGQRTVLELKVDQGGDGGPAASGTGPTKPAPAPARHVMHPRRTMPKGSAKGHAGSTNPRIQALRKRIEARRQQMRARTKQEH